MSSDPAFRPPGQRKDIKQKYEVIYHQVAQVVENAVSSDTDPIRTYLNLKVQADAAWGTMSWLMQSDKKGLPPAAEQTAFMNAFPMQRLTWAERGQYKEGTRADWVASHSALFSQSYLAHIPKCDLVLDLGCGWGHRMADLYLAGLRTPTIGGDRSPDCRRAVTALAKLFPDIDMDWFQFDYLAPDFTALPDAFHTCVYSCHAIEQVATLGPALFDRLLEKYPLVSGVHIEPIAFQIDASRVQDHLYAKRKAYNLDLYETIRSHPRLKVLHSEPAIMDMGAGNASSLLVWTARY